MNHQLIHGIASRSVNAHSQSDDLELHLFDIVDESTDQMSRILKLGGIASILKEQPDISPVHVVNFIAAETLDDVLHAYDYFISRGYEGIVIRELSAPYIRRRSTSIMKFKPKREDLYEIVGFSEEVSILGMPKASLGALECRAQFGEARFHVGSGFTADQRREYWACRETLIGNTVRIAYQHTTPGRGVPRFPVFVEILWTKELSDD
jgi:ATP-dependent DNA ligase